MYYPNDFSSSTEVSIFHSPSSAQISSFNCINIPQTLSFPQENSQSSMEFSTNFCWDEEGFTLQSCSFFENKSDFCLSSDKDTTLGERTLCRTFKSSCENAIESLDMWAEEGLETNEEKINGMSYSTETRDLSVFNNSTSNQSYNYNTISQTLSETKLQETEPMTPSESNTEQQTIKQLFSTSKRTERGRRKKLGSKGISARVLAGSDLKRTKITKHLLDSVVVTANALIEHLSKTHSLPPLKFGTLNKEFKEKMSLKKSEVKNKKIAEILNQKENNKFKKSVLKESLARFWRKSNVDKIEKMSTEGGEGSDNFLTRVHKSNNETLFKILEDFNIKEFNDLFNMTVKEYIKEYYLFDPKEPKIQPVLFGTLPEIKDILLRENRSFFCNLKEKNKEKSEKYFSSLEVFLHIDFL